MSTSPAATSSAPQVRIEKGELLFRQDEHATHLFVVTSGQVEISRRVFRESFVVETLGAGGVCGEVAMLEGAWHAGTATALDTVVVVPIAREEIPGLLASNPDLAARIIRKLAVRLTHAHYRTAAFALRSDIGRVMLQLRTEAQRHGALGAGVLSPLPWDLPEVLAMEKDRVETILRDLVNRGMLELDGSGRFRVVDVDVWDRNLHYLELHDRFGVAAR